MVDVDVEVEVEDVSPCCGTIDDDDDADADVALAITNDSSEVCCSAEVLGMGGRGKIGRERAGGIVFTFLDGLLVLLLPERVVVPPCPDTS
jgi:hypothetical protein